MNQHLSGSNLNYLPIPPQRDLVGTVYASHVIKLALSHNPLKIQDPKGIWIPLVPIPLAIN